MTPADGAPKLTTGRDTVELAREALLPCPFCGQPAVRMIDLSTRPKTHSYRCDNDDCDVKPTTCQKTDKAVALKLWNTRALDAQRGSVEATEDEMKQALESTDTSLTILSPFADLIRERLSRANLAIVRRL